MGQKNTGSPFPFSHSDVQRVLGSDSGKKLLALLNQDGGQALRQAAEALKQGNYAQAQQLLSPIMDTKEAAQLVEALNQKAGGGHG